VKGVAKLEFDIEIARSVIAALKINPYSSKQLGF
jgi:hypothetical protein